MENLQVEKEATNRPSPIFLGGWGLFYEFSGLTFEPFLAD